MSGMKGELKGVSKLAPKATPASSASATAGDGKSLSGDFNSEAAAPILAQLEEANKSNQVNERAQMSIKSRNHDGALYLPTGSSVTLSGYEKAHLKASTTADVQHTLAVLKTVAGSASLNGKKFNAGYIFESSAYKRLLGALQYSCELIIDIGAAKAAGVALWNRTIG